MFTTIKNWLLGVEHDIEAIIENFTSTVTKLEAAAEAKALHAREFAEKALDFGDLSDAAAVAANRARDVAAKLKALVA